MLVTDAHLLHSRIHTCFVSPFCLFFFFPRTYYYSVVTTTAYLIIMFILSMSSLTGDGEFGRVFPHYFTELVLFVNALLIHHRRMIRVFLC
ncbi:hypothetical protein BDN70DRAFT_836288, partial [Pholiota conissans]